MPETDHILINILKILLYLLIVFLSALHHKMYNTGTTKIQQSTAKHREGKWVGFTWTG